MAKKKFVDGTIIASDDLNLLIGGGGKNTWAANTEYATGVLVEADSRLWRQTGVEPNVSGSAAPAWATITIEGEVIADGTGFWQLYQGHHHDGDLNPGSMPKIQLTNAADVRGTLPVANQVEHYHNGAMGQFAKINPVSHITGVEEFEFDLVFSTDYFSTERTITCYARKDASPTSGKPAFVTLMFPRLLATSAGTGFKDLAHHIPASIRPKDVICGFCMVSDNAGYAFGCLEIDTNGDIYFGVMDTDSGDAGSIISTNFSGFTASGTKGIFAFTFVYPIWP